MDGDIVNHEHVRKKFVEREGERPPYHERNGLLWDGLLAAFILGWELCEADKTKGSSMNNEQSRLEYVKYMERAGLAQEILDQKFWSLWCHAWRTAQECPGAGSPDRPATKRDLDEMEARIMQTEQQVIDALNKIDSATTKVASNITVVAQVTQTISDEMDALELALSNAGVSQALVDQASGLGDRAQAVSDALDAQVPVLQGI